MAERLDPEVRRQRILGTAMSVLAESGYRGLTMAAVAAACSMSTPGLMHYYRDLSSLMIAVLEERDKQDRRTLAEAGVLDKVENAVEEVISTMLARPEAARLFAVLSGEAVDPSHPAHDYFLARNRVMVDALVAGCGDRYREPREMVACLIATLDGMQMHWLRDPENFDLRAQWARVERAILEAHLI